MLTMQVLPAEAGSTGVGMLAHCQCYNNVHASGLATIAAH